MGNLAREDSAEEAVVPIEVATAAVMKTDVPAPALTEYVVGGVVIPAVNFTEFKEQLILHLEDKYAQGIHRVILDYTIDGKPQGLVHITIDNSIEKSPQENIDESK